MKTEIKYGLIITIGVMVWVLLAHSIVTDQESLVHKLGSPIVFNLLHFVMIYLGLKTLERERGEKVNFKEGVKFGLTISFVYALTASLFFVGVVAMVGTRWIAGAQGTNTEPVSQILAQAFAALFIGAMLLGLVYSTLLSFFIAKRRSQT